MRAFRLYVGCYSVNPAMAEAFKLYKSNGAGEFPILYMEAGFDKDAEWAEFYLEFKDQVWDHKVREAFRAMGANQVTTATFAKQDNHEGASSALARVWHLAEKTGIHYSRGTGRRLCRSRPRLS